MTIGTFDTAVLNRVVADLYQPKSYMLDTFFTGIQTSTDEKIYFDVDESKPRITPFVHPTKAGRVVDGLGFSTKSFSPAYAKDKREFNPNRVLKRTLGERIGGSLNPAQRNALLIRTAMEDQLQMLTRREELMAVEAMLKGTVTVSGEGYPEAVVDFGRDAALTLALAGAARWSDNTVNRVNDLEDWVTLIQEKSGAVSTRITMDPKAWRLFKAGADIEKRLEYRRGTNTTINIDPLVLGQGEQKSRYGGSIGELDFFIYQDVYVDEAGDTQKYIPDNTVVIGGSQIEGTRAYGMIHDEKANFSAQRYFSKSWLENDPAVRWLLLQSAPLVVPYRPNASMAITVA